MPEQTKLTTMDRCDRCRAQAQARTLHADGMLSLLWCSHCFTKHKDKLLPHLVYLQDVTGQDRTKEAQRV